MPSTSLPMHPDRFHKLSFRGAGVVAALAVQLLVSGCWPGGNDNAAKDNKMQPMAAANTMAPKPAPAAAPAGTGAVVAKVNGTEIREGDLKMAEEDIGRIDPSRTKTNCVSGSASPKAKSP